MRDTKEFGILTDVDVKAALRKKLDVDFRNYRILGACNPSFAHRALETEDKIGIIWQNVGKKTAI